MRAALYVLALALLIYALIDCARTPDEDMPARMPKMLWIALIVLLTPVGPIAWVIVSRVKAAEERGGTVERTVWSSERGPSFHRPVPPRPVAPDDDPEFLRRLETQRRQKAREEKLNAKESELKAREERLKKETESKPEQEGEGEDPKPSDSTETDTTPGGAPQQ